MIICLLILVLSCEEEMKTNLDDKGQILFFTNVHDKLNCEPFDVEVNIEGVLKGKLSHSSNEGSLLCRSTDSTLIVELNTGTYNYLAEIKNLKNNVWTQQIEVHRDSCLTIFLDFMQLNYQESQLKKKLIGSWIEIGEFCDSCLTLSFNQCNELITSDNFSEYRAVCKYKTNLDSIEMDCESIFEGVPTSFNTNFISNDTLEIIDFKISLIEENSFENILLKRIE